MRLQQINFEALKTFQIAAQSLSFTQAAQRLHITQSAVSQQIRSLEQGLGFALFIRKSRSLRLTEQGQILLDCVNRSFADIYQTLKQLQGENHALHINCLPSLALQWLMPRLSDFHLAHRDIVVKLKAEFQALDREVMQNQQIDLGIRYDPHPFNPDAAEVILDEYLIAVATPDYLAQHPAFAQAQSLAGVTLLHDAMPWIGAPAYIEWQTYLEQFKPQWLDGISGIEFNLSSLAISAALNHQGVAIGRSALVLDELLSGRLVNVFDVVVKSKANYKLLYPHHAHADVEVFTQWLQQQTQYFAQQRLHYFTQQQVKYLTASSSLGNG
ncbi:LysR substrate-binding domain-containing protein [Acinetobacter larvae]|uniref:LysR substrate-binding domain-containing protein n=1 Tax=Acinetobacter larvae TaxID=1789224 RepID=UPI0009D79910|nr:LysR family transcriptional regulator [Acinetobacter larvae]